MQLQLVQKQQEHKRLKQLTRLISYQKRQLLERLKTHLMLE